MQPPSSPQRAATKHSLQQGLLRPPMSFISVEPQPRVVLESHSDSLLAQFDTQLRVIADRYLAFFQERFIIIARILHLTLTVRFSGEVLRQPSQFHLISQSRHKLMSSHKVSILYGNSFAKQISTMPRMIHVSNRRQREQHGTM